MRDSDIQISINVYCPQHITVFSTYKSVIIKKIVL